jgi:hypothetical protein
MFLILKTRFSKKYSLFHSNISMKYRETSKKYHSKFFILKNLKGGLKNMGKKILTAGALLLVGLLATSAVMAYQGDPSEKGPNFSEERHEEMRDAFDNLDYQSWYDLMTEDGRNPRIVEVITEDNFADFAEANELALNGDLSAMNQFREQFGLGLGGMRHGEGRALGRGHGPEEGRHNCPNA